MALLPKIRSGTLSGGGGTGLLSVKDFAREDADRWRERRWE